MAGSSWRVHRRGARPCRVSVDIGRDGSWRDERGGWRAVSAVAHRQRGRSDRGHCAHPITGRYRIFETEPPVNVLTPANQITLLRMLLIPAFVVLVVDHRFGWALIVFTVAGLTDALDG